MRLGRTIKIIFAAVLLGALIFFGKTPAVAGLKNAVYVLARPLISVSRYLKNKFGGGPVLKGDEALRVLEESARANELDFENQKLRAENERLAAGLGLKERTGLNLAASRVIFYFQEMGREFLLIDKGKDAGFEKNYLVIDGNGLLVGTIVEVGADFSKVEIASNPDSAFETELLPTGLKSLARGLGNRTFNLNFIPFDATSTYENFVYLAPTSSANRTAYSAATGNLDFVLGRVNGEKINPGSAFKNVTAYLLAKPELLKEVFTIK